MGWWPGWNSADNANTWAHIWFWFGMWCFLWLGISEVIAFVYGLRKDHLVEATQTATATQAQQTQDALQKQLSEADKKLADLQKFQTQRHLSDADKQALIARISQFRGTKIAIGSLFGDDDGERYRDDFVDVLNRAGWALDGHIGIMQMVPSPTGVVVGINKTEAEANRVPVAAEVLATALADLHIINRTPDGKVPVSIGDDVPTDRIRLIIGSKPRPN